MQPRFVVGDTLAFTRSLPDYPAGAWTLHYRLQPDAGAGQPVAFGSTAEGADHAIEVPAADTAQWHPGAYTWASWVTDGTRSHTVGQGRTTLLPDPRTATAPMDLRSEAQVALANVRATLRGKATSDVLSYTIAGRSLQRYSIAELIQLEHKLAVDVAREATAQAVAAGRPSGRWLGVRIGRA